MNNTKSKRILPKAAKGKAPVCNDLLPGKPAVFNTHDELLDAALRMFSARRKLSSLSENASANPESLDNHENLEKAWTSFWHQSLEATNNELVFCEKAKAAALDRTEREILVALLLARLGLIQYSLKCANDLLEYICVPTSQGIMGLRSISEHGRLFQSQFISYEDPDEDIRERQIILDPVLLDMVLFGNEDQQTGWPMKTETELYQYMVRLSRAFREKSDKMDDLLRGYGRHSATFKWDRKIQRLLKGLMRTLIVNPSWKLSLLLSQFDAEENRMVLLALIGKELGHMKADDPLFTGGGLVRLVCPDAAQYCRMLTILTQEDQLGACRT